MSGARQPANLGAKAAKKVRQQSRETRRRRLNLMLAAAGVAVVAVIGLIVVGGALRGGDSVASGSQRGGRTLGSADAPVIVAAWEDFQCPVCKRANQTVFLQLQKEYIDTGKVRFQYRHFAFLGDESVWAAEASECAAEQDQFWPYHDALFNAQSGENQGAFTKAKLKAMATPAGLDSESFKICLDSDRYKAAIEAERDQGKGLGVAGTPTFFVNGSQVLDWSSYASMKAMIDRALAGR